jgi:hypothetical protein
MRLSEEGRESRPRPGAGEDASARCRSRFRPVRVRAARRGVLPDWPAPAATKDRANRRRRGEPPSRAYRITRRRPAGRRWPRPVQNATKALMEQPRSDRLALAIRRAEPVSRGHSRIGRSTRVEQEHHDLEITPGRFQAHDSRRVEQGHGIGIAESRHNLTPGDELDFRPDASVVPEGRDVVREGLPALAVAVGRHDVARSHRLYSMSPCHRYSISSLSGPYWVPSITFATPAICKVAILALVRLLYETSSSSRLRRSGQPARISAP